MEQKPICKAYKIICMDKCSYTKLHTLSSELSVLSTVETWLTLSYLNLNLSTITGEVGEGKSERIVTGRFMVAWSVSGGEERRKEEGGETFIYISENTRAYYNFIVIQLVLSVSGVRGRCRYHQESWRLFSRLSREFVN